MPLRVTAIQSDLAKIKCTFKYATLSTYTLKSSKAYKLYIEPNLDDKTQGTTYTYIYTGYIIL